MKRNEKKSILSILIESINSSTLIVTVFLFSIMSAVVLLQVFCRYVLNSALLWPEELARFLLVWVTFLGSSIALYRGAHAAVSSLIDRVPAQLRQLIGMGIYCVIFIFLALFTKYSFQVALISASDVSPALGARLIWPRLALPVGSLLMLTNTAYLFIQHARCKDPKLKLGGNEPSKVEEA